MFIKEVASHLRLATQIFSYMLHTLNSEDQRLLLLLETLADFIMTYHIMLTDWLQTCISLLLQRLDSDIPQYLYNKVDALVDLIRVSFPGDLQFNVISTIVVEQESPSVQMMLLIVTYLLDLIDQMSVDEFVATDDVTLAVSRLLIWMTEPDSLELRELTSTLLKQMHSLSALVFNSVVSRLPYAFQDVVNSKIMYWKEVEQHLPLRCERVKSRIVAPDKINELDLTRSLNASKFRRLQVETETQEKLLSRPLSAPPRIRVHEQAEVDRHAGCEQLLQIPEMGTVTHHSLANNISMRNEISAKFDTGSVQLQESPLNIPCRPIRSMPNMRTEAPVDVDTGTTELQRSELEDNSYKPLSTLSSMPGVALGDVDTRNWQLQASANENTQCRYLRSLPNVRTEKPGEFDTTGVQLQRPNISCQFRNIRSSNGTDAWAEVNTRDMQLQGSSYGNSSHQSSSSQPNMCTETPVEVYTGSVQFQRPDIGDCSFKSRNTLSSMHPDALDDIDTGSRQFQASLHGHILCRSHRSLPNVRSETQEHLYTGSTPLQRYDLGGCSCQSLNALSGMCADSSVDSMRVQWSLHGNSPCQSLRSLSNMRTEASTVVNTGSVRLQTSSGGNIPCQSVRSLPSLRTETPKLGNTGSVWFQESPFGRNPCPSPGSMMNMPTETPTELDTGSLQVQRSVLGDCSCQFPTDLSNIGSETLADTVNGRTAIQGFSRGSVPCHSPGSILKMRTETPVKVDTGSLQLNKLDLGVCSGQFRKTRSSNRTDAWAEVDTGNVRRHGSPVANCPRQSICSLPNMRTERLADVSTGSAQLQGSPHIHNPHQSPGSTLNMRTEALINGYPGSTQLQGSPHGSNPRRSPGNVLLIETSVEVDTGSTQLQGSPHGSNPRRSPGNMLLTETSVEVNTGNTQLQESPRENISCQSLGDQSSVCTDTVAQVNTGRAQMHMLNPGNCPSRYLGDASNMCIYTPAGGDTVRVQLQGSYLRQASSRSLSNAPNNTPTGNDTRTIPLPGSFSSRRCNLLNLRSETPAKADTATRSVEFQGSTVGNSQCQSIANLPNMRIETSAEVDTRRIELQGSTGGNSLCQSIANLPNMRIETSAEVDTRRIELQGSTGGNSQCQSRRSLQNIRTDRLAEVDSDKTELHGSMCEKTQRRSLSSLPNICVDTRANDTGIVNMRSEAQHDHTGSMQLHKSDGERSQKSSLNDHNIIESGPAATKADSWEDVDLWAVDWDRPHNYKQQEIHKVVNELFGPETTCQGVDEATEALYTMCAWLEQDIFTADYFDILLTFVVGFLAHPKKSLRLAALRALSTLIVSFCERFADKQAIGVFEYLLHLTDDRSAKVRRLADWCVIALVECVPAELCLNYLALLTTFAGHRVHAAAICLIMQIIRGASKEMMNNKVVGSIIDCLFEGYCSEDDEVQRASLRCLSIIYNVVGRDCMEPHMAHLTSSQLKLLDSSVRRAKREEILVRHSLSKRR